MNADRTRLLGERFAFFNDDMVDAELFQAMREKQAYGSGTEMRTLVSSVLINGK